MKRPRPHIPLSVVVHVVQRQLIETMALWRDRDEGETLTAYVEALLGFLAAKMDATVLHLDHDPALILREFNPRTGKYTPDANDPAYLIYREKSDHQQKTTGRKPGAERTVTTKGSDIGLKTKFARLARPKKRKAKIASRPFPKQRKFR